MARMKFLCDAERCIECNGCVTACKNVQRLRYRLQERERGALGRQSPSRGDDQ